MANQKGDTFLHRWVKNEPKKYYAFMFLTNVISAVIGSVLTKLYLIPLLQKLGYL